MPAIDAKPGILTEESAFGQAALPGVSEATAPEVPTPNTDSKPRVAATLEEVLEAIVKFEVPAAGGARVLYGCGFLVDQRGWIATNHHVIAGATTAARASFADGTTCELAGIVAVAPEHDLAVIQLKDPPPGLPLLDLSYEGDPRLALGVYAFGHPYNADFSLTRGIVSRVLTTADLNAGSWPLLFQVKKVPGDLVWVQHDARISPGNSGGPLLDEAGRVLGMNAFLNVKTGFGYASHVRYLRDLLASAPAELTPLPPGDTRPKRSQVVVSAGKMKELFDAGSAFEFTPKDSSHYQALADLARQMTFAKHLQVEPKAVRAPPQAVRGMVGFTDQIFRDLRKTLRTQDQSEAVNRFAAERLDAIGQGTVMFTTVVGSISNGLLLNVEGTKRQVLVPATGQLGQFPRGSRWVLLGVITPKIASLKSRQQPEPRRLPIVLTHYMIKIDS